MTGVPTFDIEARDWTEPIAVGFTDGEKYFEFLKRSEDTDVIWEFLSYIGDNCEGMGIFAHNAGGYDNKFILDSLIKHKQKIKLEAGLGRVTWTDKEISFEDSMLVVGTGLANLCKAFGIPRKLDWDHRTTKNIWELEHRLDSFRAYLQRDVTSLSRAMEEYCKMLIRSFAVTPSATLSLTAVKAFNKNFFKVSDIKSNEKFEPFIRRAMYAGRNEVYKRYGENLNLYDIRSMYISCYDSPIPVGEMFWRKPKIEKGSIGYAWVEIPKDWKIGPLPYKLGNHLAFPVGTFPDWWDMVELRKAEEVGVNVKLIKQLECDEYPILKEFGEYVSLLRYSSNPELGKLYKLLGIRVSGKFGQHRWREEIAHSEDIEDFEGYTPIDSSEVYHKKSVYLPGNKAPYCKPAVAMRIRAMARVRHLDFLLKSDPYYCDTDSIYTNAELPLGLKAGELQLVDKAQRAYFIRGKLYGYIDTKGILRQRAAGFRDFRLTEYDFKEMLKGKDVAYNTKPIGNWADILNEQGLNKENIPRRVRGDHQLENRILDGRDTRPLVVTVKESRIEIEEK
jgi:hypothetical protein